MKSSMSLFFLCGFLGAGPDACLLQGDGLRGPAQQMDQEVLQVQADELLGPELLRLLAGHILQVGVVQTAGRSSGAPRSRYPPAGSAPSHPPCRIFPRKNSMAGLSHWKEDDHQVGGRCGRWPCTSWNSPGWWKATSPRFRMMCRSPPVTATIPLVHADKLPEVVGFPGEFEIAHIFKVVDAVQLSHG